MSNQPEQTFATHSRYVPLFHFVAGPILAGYFIYAAYVVVRAPVLDNVVDLLVAFALLIVYGSVRSFATAVQDRVIRLEEQLRYERLFPGDLRARMPEFTRDHYVALRFASDEELPALARTVLDQKITARSEIKKMIRTWRADHMRA